MRTALLLIATIAPAMATECKVENWKYSAAGGGGSWTYIEGTSNCPTGTIHLRIFEGEKFLGVNRGHIDGFAFKSSIQMKAPKTMRIQYVITQP